jgi:transposase-like protein
MTISNELLDELLKGCKRPEDLLGDAGLMKELKIRLMERMLGAELTAHLGYEAGAEPPPPSRTNEPNAQRGDSQTLSLRQPRPVA